MRVRGELLASFSDSPWYFETSDEAEMLKKAYRKCSSRCGKCSRKCSKCGRCRCGKCFTS